jgi:two-component system NtrC family response regulator
MAMFHVAKLCKRYGEGTKGMSPSFLDALTAYDWPGNVRELVNALTRALAAAQDEPTLYPTHLPPEIRIQLARKSFKEETPPPRTTFLCASGRAQSKTFPTGATPAKRPWAGWKPSISRTS